MTSIVIPIMLSRDKNAQPISGIWHPKESTTEVVQTNGTSTTASDNAIIRIICNPAAYVEFKQSGTSTSSDMLLPANVSEYFKIEKNEFVAVNSGTAWITWVN